MAGKPKLFDFGLAAPTNDRGRPLMSIVRCGTKPFSAPEVAFTTLPYDATAADIWSLGVTTFVLITVHLPYSGPRLDVKREQYQNFWKYSQVYSNISINGKVKNRLPKTLLLISFGLSRLTAFHFIGCLLSAEVDNRASADQLLRLPWLNLEDGKRPSL